MNPIEFRKFVGEPFIVDQEWLDKQADISVVLIIEKCKKSFLTCIHLRAPFSLFDKLRVPSRLNESQEKYVIDKVRTTVLDFLQEAYPEKSFRMIIGERCFCAASGFIAYNLEIIESKVYNTNNTIDISEEKQSLFKSLIQHFTNSFQCIVN